MQAQDKIDGCADGNGDEFRVLERNNGGDVGISHDEKHLFQLFLVSKVDAVVEDVYKAILLVKGAIEFVL